MAAGFAISVAELVARVPAKRALAISASVTIFGRAPGLITTTE
jgi:hypothetical protein